MDATEDDKHSTGRRGGIIAAVVVVVLCVACGIAVYVAPVYGADAQTGAEASVTVEPLAGGSYGANVVQSDRCLFGWLATGEPDGWSAVILHKGWIGVELERRLPDCHEVAVWAAGTAWGSLRFDVYVSADGETWAHVGGGRCTSGEHIAYRFDGDFGDVAYVGVKRHGPAWALLLLDAVWAGASDESE